MITKIPANLIYLDSLEQDLMEAENGNYRG
jgi:hypothetical protein